MRPIEQIRPGTVQLSDPHTSEAPSQTLFEEFQDYLSKIVSHSTISNQSQSVSALNDAIAAGGELKAKEKDKEITEHIEVLEDSSNKNEVIKQQTHFAESSNAAGAQIPADNTEDSSEVVIENPKEKNKEATDSSNSEVIVEDNVKVDNISTSEVVAVVTTDASVVAQSVAAAGEQTATQQSVEIVEISSKEELSANSENNVNLENPTIPVSNQTNAPSQGNLDSSVATQSSDIPKEGKKPIDLKTPIESSSDNEVDNNQQVPTQSSVNILELPSIEDEVLTEVNLVKQKAADNLKAAGLEQWNTISQAVSQYLALTSAGILKNVASNIASTSSKEITGIEAKNSSSPFSSNPFLAPQSVALQAKGSESRAAAKSAPKPMTKSAELRTFERVEQVLKEAVKSKDGKSISFRLDPPNLGKVQVDVFFKDGALRARIVPESQQVGNILREKSYELVNSLRKLGLNVEKISLSISTDNFVTGDSGLGTSSQGSNSGNDNRSGGESSNFESQEGSVVVAAQGNALNNIDHWVA